MARSRRRNRQREAARQGTTTMQLRERDANRGGTVSVSRHAPSEPMRGAVLCPPTSPSGGIADDLMQDVAAHYGIEAGQVTRDFVLQSPLYDPIMFAIRSRQVLCVNVGMKVGELTDQLK